jgi:hypothetical protein
MIPLMFSTVITCSQAISILNRVTSVVGLTNTQKAEIIMQLKTLVPTCPVTIKKDEPKKK